MNRDLLLPYRDSADGPICEYAFKIRKKKNSVRQCFKAPTLTVVQYSTYMETQSLFVYLSPNPLGPTESTGLPLCVEIKIFFFCRTKISKSLMFYFFVKKVY